MKMRSICQREDILFALNKKECLLSIKLPPSISKEFTEFQNMKFKFKCLGYDYTFENSTVQYHQDVPY